MFVDVRWMFITANNILHTTLMITACSCQLQSGGLLPALAVVAKYLTQQQPAAQAA
jgi:hypothetical protein